MAPRYYWKGYLKLSLVTCPVAMTPATSESEKVRFHTLNRETGNRVVSQYVDSGTGKRVKDENEAKGYARGENDYVMLTDDDLDRVALDTVKTIDIEKFVPADSIEWIYLEKPHYLMPDDAVGNEAFAVIRDAMNPDNVVGVSKLVVGRREKAVVLEPRDEGIAKAIMIELTAFGTRGGGRSANAYDAVSNGNFDDDQPLLGTRH
jgi:DNA end-binding protein Ku